MSCICGSKIPGETHVFQKKAMQFFLAVLHPHAVPRIDNPNNGVRLFEIVTPIRPQGPLTADVPCDRIYQVDGRKPAQSLDTYTRSRCTYK